MIRLFQSIFAGIFLSAAVLSAHAVTILDDTFADGTRNIQNLPAESAWYCSSGSSLTAAPGAMTLQMGSTAILAVSYFTTNANDPVSLNVGDTLSANITYTFTGVGAVNSSQGFRLALGFFGANRATADFSSNGSQGVNVPGYAVFQNMGLNFNNTTPTILLLRTNLPDKSILGTSSDWESLGTGPGSTNNFPGFANNVPYTLQFSAQRTDVNVMQITATWLNDVTGAILSTEVTDMTATNFSFDGIGLRPLTAASTASDIIFNEVQVEYVAAATPPSVSANPQDQSVFTSQTATFSVIADGTPPFTYQWLYNNNTVLTNQNSATLVITNAQLSDTGGYSVIVSNAYGSATSDNGELTVTTPTAPVIVTQPQSQLFPGRVIVLRSWWAGVRRSVINGTLTPTPR
jgi:hypothetical protein